MAPSRARSVRPHRWTILALALTFALGASSCRRSNEVSTDRSPESGAITIAAAASLQGAFSDLAAAFEAGHPSVTVNLVFGSSSTLVQQILNGAPVDVLATADERNMQRVVDAGFARGEPTLFASTSLEIIVRRGNPSNITSVSDLSLPGVVFVTCAPEVPVGNYAAQVLQKAGIRIAPASFEQDVKGIVAKVTSGEADAGIVYATDVRAAAGAAVGIALPASLDVSAKYPIVGLVDGAKRELQNAWIAFVTGNEGQAILIEHGFVTP